MERFEGSDRPLIVMIPEALREKLGPDGARALAELLNDTSMQIRGDVIEIAASRFERGLAEEIGSLRSELHAEIGGLRADIGAFEGRITRWMFVFWIGQIGALLGILFAFFRT